MMRAKIVMMLILSNFLFATTPKVKILELYPNYTFLTYKFTTTTSAIKIDMPGFVNKQNISISSECKVLKTLLVPREAIKDNFQNSLEKLTKNKELLDKKLVAQKTKNGLLRKYDFKNISIEKLKSSSRAYEKLLFNSLQEESKLEEEMIGLEKKIQNLHKKRSFKKKKSLEIYVDCDKPSATTLTFPLKGVSYSGLTVFDADSKTKKLQILQEAFITHSLGDILKNVNIKLYSFAYTNPKSPAPFYPDYLNIYEPIVEKMAVDGMMANAPMPSSIARGTVHQKAKEVETRTKRVWEAENVSLIAGEENEVIFNEQSSNIEFVSLIDGYGSVKAYLEGEFKPKQSIVNQKSKFFLDGVLVGEKYIGRMEKNKNSKIYFGRNDFIKVKKETDKEFTDESIFGTSKTTKKLWNYEIENTGKIKESVVLAERLPISQHEKIKVEMQGSDKPHSQQKDGKVEWRFDLKPKEIKKIHFGYSITEPINK